MFKKCFLLLFLLPCLGLGQALPDTVVFRINMQSLISRGDFKPDADRVGVRGNEQPLSWGISVVAEDMDKDGVYEARIPFVRKNERVVKVSYKFKLERAGSEPNTGWEDGPNRMVVVNGQSKVERSFNAPPEPIPPTFTGRIITHEAFASKYLPARNVYVYLPPDYDKNPQKRYPVLYMHDGRNVLDASVIGQEWEMDEAAEQLIIKGDIQPFILVGIDNTSHRIFEYTPDAIVYKGKQLLKRVDQPIRGDDLVATPARYGTDFLTGVTVTAAERGLWLRSHASASLLRLDKQADGSYTAEAPRLRLQFLRDQEGLVNALEITGLTTGGGGFLYGKMLTEEIKPFIDRNYRTHKKANHTFVGGSSLGGLLSMALGLAYPNVFGGLLVVSPSVWWNGESLISRVEQLKRKNRQKIWVDMGTAEGANAVATSNRLVEALQAKGWTSKELRYVVAPNAQHNEAAWAVRAPDMLRFLFGDKK